MKKSSLFLLLLVLTLLLSACSTSSTSKAKNITLADLNTALESTDVDLKTVDDGKNINDIYNFGERDFKPHSITIRANSKAMDEVIARYGMNVNITIIDEEHFCAEITVYNRKELNAWLSSHPEIRLVSMPLPRKG